jgi:hypothetical protein
MQAVEEVPRLQDCERCWAETSSNWEEYDTVTEEMANTAVYNFCTTRIQF